MNMFQIMCLICLPPMQSGKYFSVGAVYGTRSRSLGQKNCVPELLQHVAGLEPRAAYGGGIIVTNKVKENVVTAIWLQEEMHGRASYLTSRYICIRLY